MNESQFPLVRGNTNECALSASLSSDLNPNPPFGAAKRAESVRLWFAADIEGLCEAVNSFLFLSLLERDSINTGGTLEEVLLS